MPDIRVKMLKKKIDIKTVKSFPVTDFYQINAKCIQCLLKPKSVLLLVVGGSMKAGFVAVRLKNVEREEGSSRKRSRERGGSRNMDRCLHWSPPLASKVYSLVKSDKGISIYWERWPIMPGEPGMDSGVVG